MSNPIFKEHNVCIPLEHMNLSYAFVDHVVFLRASAISLLLNVAYHLQNLLK